MAVNKIDLNNLDKSNWKSFRFDEIAQNISERVDPNNTDLEVYIGLEHIDSESLHIKRFGTSDDVNGQKLKFYKGDIIFGRRRAYQRKAGIVTCDGFCSAHSLVLRANPEVIAQELFPFFLHSDLFMHRAVDISVGSLSPTINWGTLKGQQFLLPPKEMQTRLAGLLWSLEDALESEGLVRMTLNKVRLSIREKLLYSSDHPRVKLGGLVNSIVAGKSLNGENISPQNNEKAVLKVSAVGPSGFAPNESKVLHDQNGFLTKFQINEGDILITRANTAELVGRVCLVDSSYPNLMLCDKTLKLVIDKGKVDNDYLVEVLNSYESRRQIESFATGTGGAMKNITQNEILSIKIPLPKLQEQKKLAKKIRLLKDNYRNHVGQEKQAYGLKKNILNQVF